MASDPLLSTPINTRTPATVLTLVIKLVEDADLVALEGADVQVQNRLAHHAKLPLEFSVLRFNFLSRFDNEKIVQVFIPQNVLVPVLLDHEVLIGRFREIAGEQAHVMFNDVANVVETHALGLCNAALARHRH